MVQVVHCPEVSLPPKQSARKSAGASERSGDKPGRKRPRSEKEEFKEAFVAARNLGASQFIARERKAYENKQRELKGAKKAKNQKLPYKMLMGMNAAHKKWLERTERQAKEAGIVLPTKKKQKKQERERSFDSKIGPAPSVGRMLKGILRVGPAGGKK